MADTKNNKKLEDYGSFEYAEYQDNDSIKKGQEQLDSWQKPGDFSSQYTEAAKQALEKYLNRDKFTYDLNGDALYQQYKDQYINQGKLAMQDTIGQASAMTGGYGNSYAQNVGQQTYQGYLQQLNDKVPELYQLALDQYNQEGENMLNQYGLLSDRENTEYGRYRDTVSDAYAERDYLTNQLNAEREFDYSKYSDQRNFDYNQFSDDRNLGYQLDRDSIADSQWQAGFDEEVRQFDENMAFNKEQFEVQQQQWSAEFNESVRQYEQEYKLKIRQIEEDERNGKVSREVALREMALAEEKFKADKEQAAASLAAKYVNSGYKQNSKGDWEKESDFEKYTYAGLTEDGESKFYRDGKEYTYESGVNPYTGTKNPDAKNGTFNNGYQPDNVNGKKLSKTGITDEVNGVTQNVWKDTKGNKWIWDGTQNKYLRYED